MRASNGVSALELALAGRAGVALTSQWEGTRDTRRARPSAAARDTYDFIAQMCHYPCFKAWAAGMKLDWQQGSACMS